MARADGVLVPIPYDFDATGIVNPPYALPAAGLSIRNVRVRLYRGQCRDAADLTASATSRSDPVLTRCDPMNAE